MKHLANSFILIDPDTRKAEGLYRLFWSLSWKTRFFLFLSTKMIISYSLDDICKERWKYCRIPSRLNPVEFIRPPPPKSGRENYDRLECNWRGGPTLPLNALSAVFWCRVGPKWKRKGGKKPAGKEREWEAIGLLGTKGTRGEGGIEPERKKYVVKPD